MTGAGHLHVLDLTVLVMCGIVMPIVGDISPESNI